MAKSPLLVSVALALLAVASSAAAGKSPAPDPALEQRIAQEIGSRDPDGAALFARANDARDKDNLDGAADLYGQVIARDPWFVHAKRRLCGVEMARGHRDRALTLCREAVKDDPSAYNETTLAGVLTGGEGATAADDASEALRLSRDAASKLPGDVFVEQVYCQSAFAAGQFQELSSCSGQLQHLAPDEASTWLFSAVSDGVGGKPDDAERELEKARARGIPEPTYKKLHEAIEDSRSPVDRYWPIVWRALAGWLAGFVLLLGLGVILSAATMRSAGRVPAELTGHARGLDAVLRRTYRVVLLVTCAYYYASLPIVALVVVGLGAGLVYMCLALGRIPVKLMVIAAVIVLWTLWAIAKSLFVRGRDEDPGERLDLEEHPKLRAVLDEVAARIGTRPVDSVYMTPGTDIAVLERGGLLKQLRGRAERCLVLGAAVLEGMRVRELKGILAHEYGHFHNEDTAGGGFALAVRRSLLTMAMHLVRGKVASNVNPAWWFVRGFHAVFLRVSQGASRLQEMLADRWAAVAYGSEAFEKGLTHVIQRTVRFDAQVTATINEVVPKQQPLANLYAHVPAEPVDPNKIDRAIEKAMTRPSSAYDSHPRPADRIAWVHKLAAQAPAETGDDLEEAWTLLASREQIERRMTDEVRAQLAMQGVRLMAA